MAFNFVEGSTQFLALSNNNKITAYPFSMACWAWIDRVGSTPLAFMWIGGEASSAEYAALFFNDNQDDKLWAQSVIGGGAQSISAAAMTAGKWFHVGGTWASATSRIAYLDGVAATPETTSKTVSGNDAAIGYFNDTSPAFPLDGRIMEAGFWGGSGTDVLSAANMATLAAGYSPLFVRPDILKMYLPLVRNSNDIVGGVTVVENGTPTVIQHNSIIYPSAPHIITAPAAVGGLDSIPVGMNQYFRRHSQPWM